MSIAVGVKAKTVVRRVVVAIAGLLVIAACLYPPYQVEAFYPVEGKTAEEIVYASLCSPQSG